MDDFYNDNSHRALWNTEKSKNSSEELPVKVPQSKKEAVIVIRSPDPTDLIKSVIVSTLKSLIRASLLIKKGRW